MESANHQPEDTTPLGVTTADKRWLLAIGIGGGAAIGLLLPLVWSWIEDLPLPGKGPLELMMSLQFTAVAVIRPIVLAAIGGTALWLWAITQPILRIGGDQIVVERGEQRRVIRRDQVAGAYLDGSKVVIDSVEGRTLFSNEVEGAKKHAREAFIRHGYPWESV